MSKPSAIFLGTRLEALHVIKSNFDVKKIITTNNSHIHNRKFKNTILVNKKNKNKIFDLLKNSDVKLIFSAGFPFIIPKNILSICTDKIFLNSHPSFLPLFKGRKSITKAFEKGAKEYGSTVHFMNHKVDSGKILTQKKIIIKENNLKKVQKKIFSFLEPKVIKESMVKLKKIMKPNILIIGGNGYIGNVLVRFLLDQGMNVTVLDNLIYKHKKINLKNLNNFKFIKADYRYYRDIDNLIKNNDVFIFLAGLVGDPITKKYPKLSKSINNTGIKKFINKIKNFNDKKFIFVSTCSNYGVVSKNTLANEKHILSPLSFYAKDKVEIEKYILKKLSKSNVVNTILRFATAFGLSNRMRYDLTINEFVRTLFLNKKLLVYDTDTYRPYCHVKDFSRLIYKVIISNKKKVNNEIFNCGDNKFNYSKMSITKKISKYFKSPRIEYKKTPSADRRNYLVNFTKLNKKLVFKCKYNIDYGIKEIIKNLKLSKLEKVEKLGNYIVNVSK